MLHRLKGALNVAHVIGAYEDDDSVFIVLEYCSGGELWARVGKLHYSERTVGGACFASPFGYCMHVKHSTQLWAGWCFVDSQSQTNAARQAGMLMVSNAVQAASYMRAVLRTLAQCHARRILHRCAGVARWPLFSCQLPVAAEGSSPLLPAAAGQLMCARCQPPASPACAQGREEQELPAAVGRRAGAPEGMHNADLRCCCLAQLILCCAAQAIGLWPGCLFSSLPACLALTWAWDGTPWCALTMCLRAEIQPSWLAALGASWLLVAMRVSQGRCCQPTRLQRRAPPGSPQACQGTC